MSISLTYDISIKWNDNRLAFANLFLDRENFLSRKDEGSIWNPFQHMLVKNADLGNINIDPRVYIKLIPSTPNDLNPEHAYEKLEYSGSKNFLKMGATSQLTYTCNFDLWKFPFDQQSCPLDFKVYHSQGTNFRFKNGTISYNGPSYVDQFKLQPIDFRLNQTKKYTVYAVQLSFKRIPLNQLQKTYLPIFLMGILGYSTLFVDLERLDLRFTGTLTTILVQATWIGIINYDLPTTPYVKLIEVWFTWHIIMTSLVILFRVFLDAINKKFNLNNRHTTEGTHGEMIPNNVLSNNINPMTENFNRFGIMLVAGSSCLFYGIFFPLALGKI